MVQPLSGFSPASTGSGSPLPGANLAPMLQGILGSPASSLQSTLLKAKEPVSQASLASPLSGTLSQGQPPDALMMVLSALMGMVEQMVSGKTSSTGNTGTTSATSTASLGAGSAGAAGGASTAGGVSSGGNASAGGNGRLKIAQIDSFSADNTGFNHGQEVAKSLRGGGGDSSLAGKVDLLQFDVTGGDTAGKTADALQNILQRVNNGEQIDAVNISQQDFQKDGNTAQVQQLIEQLAAKGVPVAVAAGNNGKSAHNELTGNSSFNVQSATNGRVNADSGVGNVTSNGRTTSFATANLTPILAAMKAQGMSLAQIRSNL